MALPVVWILGASGVGKTTVGYRLLGELAEAGVTAAYVDADQLRLAHGLEASETRLIAAALPLLEQRYRAHGARLVVVSGVADDRDQLATLLPGGLRDRLLVVQLDVDADTLRERIRGRGTLLDETEESVEYAARLDADPDLRLDTVGRTPAELARRIAEAVVPALSATRDPAGGDEVTAASPPPRRLVLMSGPGGVGLSTAGYLTYSRLARTGVPAGYVDAFQLGFLGGEAPAEELARLRAANVRVVAGAHADGGAEVVVVTGDPGTLRLLDPGSAAVVWLHASPEALAARIAMRTNGVGPGIAGDHRRGLTGARLAASIGASVRESEDPGRRPARAIVVDTSELTADGVAEAVVRAIGDADARGTVAR